MFFERNKDKMSFALDNKKASNILIQFTYTLE